MIDDFLAKSKEKTSPFKHWGVVLIVLLVHIFLLFFLLLLSFLFTAPSVKEAPLQVVWVRPENKTMLENNSAAHTGDKGGGKAKAVSIAIATGEKANKDLSVPPPPAPQDSQPSPAKEVKTVPAPALPKQVRQVSAPRTSTVPKRTTLPHSDQSAVLHTHQQASYSIPIEEEGEEAEEEISIEDNKLLDKPIRPVIPKKINARQPEVAIEKTHPPSPTGAAVPDKVSSISKAGEEKVAAHTVKVEKTKNNLIKSEKPLTSSRGKADEQVLSMKIEEGGESKQAGEGHTKGEGQNVHTGSGLKQGAGSGQGKGLQGKGNGFRKGSRYLIGRKIYPNSAKKKNQTGSVRVSVTVSPSGQVEKAALVHSSGIRSLDEAAVETARTQYRYTANSKGGIPQRSTFVFTIEYTLRDSGL